ncbi:hypothetical protein [Anaerofustis sp. NSJ-163]|uniref:hypothetical protein n=1 Tax=Anaerofustis sp. NSJ-163 TaxID=2944391 RepID=UPI00209C4313|nr:hypothetical protein [Anaerofustis sp. NSJ-163]MCO8193021.1 hypothetical protein [Anaerofustis sp. NSJ-163]
MSNKKDKNNINFGTYVSGGRAVGKRTGTVKGGLSSAFLGKTSERSKMNSIGGISDRIKSGVVQSGKERGYSSEKDKGFGFSSKSNRGYNVTRYMGERGGTFGEKGYAKIGNEYYLKSNPYSGKGTERNERPKLLKENEYGISEEKRQKINKGRIDRYIKNINPYSAPPKRIRDARAKESVEKLMNGLQKRKRGLLKNQNEGEVLSYKKGIEQVMNNYKPYGADQRNVKKQNESLYSVYPAYGSRVTKEDISPYGAKLNEFAKKKNAKMKAIEEEKNKSQNQSKKSAVQEVMSKYYKPYGTEQQSALNKENNVLFKDYPSYGSKVTSQDIQNINSDMNSLVKRVNENAKIKEKIEKEKQKEREERSEKLTNVNDFVQSIYGKDGTDNYGYSVNSVVGQPTKQNFTKENIGKSVPEYESFETKEKKAKEMEKECNADPNKEKYIKKGESTASNNTLAGPKHDTNPLKAHIDNSWYLKRGIEQDTRYKKGFDYITQEEKDTANYILGKYGAKAQAEYLSNILNRMEERKRDEKYSNMKNLGPLQIMYYGLTNGIENNARDIVQGMSLAGGNENVIRKSGKSMAIEKKKKELTGMDKRLFDGTEWVGNNIISSLGYAVNPAVGGLFDLTGEYGSGYGKSMEGEYSKNEKNDIEAGKQNAKNKMLVKGLTNVLTKGAGSAFDTVMPNDIKHLNIIKEIFSNKLNENVKDNIAPKYKDKDKDRDKK